MNTVLSILFIGLHVFVSWLLIELFVNVFHGLKRQWFVLLHYLAVFLSFATVFLVYFAAFSVFSIFTVMVIAMLFLFVLEICIFRYMYSGELWFLNYIDWIAPVFIAISSVYLAGVIMS